MLKSNTALIVVSAIGMLLFGFITWWTVVTAGGTKIEPGYSNTPNATISGPPAFK